ncbi:MAG: hypothetical protein ACKVQK_15745 [Burkholderiales bacterium]
MLVYLKSLNFPRMVLWCYLIWYLVMAAFHFDPAPGLWITSVGVSLIIGFALDLNARASGASGARGWPLARLYLFPFCVSSFSALIKDQGFVLVFSPAIAETGLALGACAAFVLLVFAVRRYT